MIERNSKGEVRTLHWILNICHLPVFVKKTTEFSIKSKCAHKGRLKTTAIKEKNVSFVEHPLCVKYHTYCV